MKIINISFLIVFFFLLNCFYFPFTAIALENNLNNGTRAGSLINEKFLSSNCLVINNFSEVLNQYQFQKINEVESQLRNLIRKHPMCADPRAVLTALLWRKGRLGEAKSNWSAAVGLDNRYSNEEWLLNSLNWPLKPTKDLLNFLEAIK